ncbi:MAG: hypothetical protein M1817_003188 [Caeruleum heppii]|nr:MAG: hypothetical protein M1817_003188 [Caeruleum heppii]
MEYRTGETCGMKLIMATYRIGNKCKTCEKIDIKLRRRAAEMERVSRWQQEGSRFRASIDRAYDNIKALDGEIQALQRDREKRYASFGG